MLWPMSRGGYPARAPCTLFARTCTLAPALCAAACCAPVCALPSAICRQARSCACSPSPSCNCCGCIPTPFPHFVLSRCPARLRSIHRTATWCLSSNVYSRCCTRKATLYTLTVPAPCIRPHPRVFTILSSFAHTRNHLYPKSPVQAVTKKNEEMKEEVIGKLKDLGNSLLGKFGMRPAPRVGQERCNGRVYSRWRGGRCYVE